MEAIQLYKSHETPPDWAIKPITGGRLKGKSDINPQWRILALTEAFGLVGFGWKYTIDKKEIVEGGNGEKVGFVDISLYVKQDGIWSEAIVGTGGSSFVAKENSGLFTSDEVYKMATTDAISVACKQLGIGAAIYSGSKYDAFSKETESKKEKEPEKPNEPLLRPMTEDQRLILEKQSKLVNIFTKEQVDKITAYISKPQAFDVAQQFIDKNEKLINSKLQPTQ